MLRPRTRNRTAASLSCADRSLGSDRTFPASRHQRGPLRAGPSGVVTIDPTALLSHGCGYAQAAAPRRIRGPAYFGSRSRPIVRSGPPMRGKRASAVAPGVIDAMKRRRAPRSALSRGLARQAEMLLRRGKQQPAVCLRGFRNSPAAGATSSPSSTTASTRSLAASLQAPDARFWRKAGRASASGRVQLPL